MPTFEDLKILHIDHLEFAVADIEKSADLFLKFGFEKLGTREVRERQLRSYLMGQNDVLFLLSQSAEQQDPVAQYVAKHGGGIFNVAFFCEDAATAVDVAARRGATVTQSPRTIEKDFGSVTLAAIRTPGDLRHTFVSRTGGLFMDGFDSEYATGIPGAGVKKLDSLSLHVEGGKRSEWKSFYENIFGLQETASIEGSQTSSLLECPSHLIRILLSEPTDATSSVQDFLNVHHGAGIARVGCSTENLLGTLRSLTERGAPLLKFPSSYYDQLAKRFHLPETAESLRQNGIIVDGNSHHASLHAFTPYLTGPLYLELVQRNGSALLNDSLTELVHSVMKETPLHQTGS